VARTRPPGFAAPADQGPLVLTERQRGAVRLVACAPEAVALGIVPGLTLADARARVPELAVLEADPRADAQWLEAIGDACDRFSPIVALDPPSGVTIDMTGVAHLFGGEAGLVAAVEARMARWSDHLRHALAATPEAAQALARFQTAPAPSEGAALRRLPVAALGLDADEARALRQAGLKTIGDLADRPAAPLAARFGEGLVDRLDRLLGQAAKPLDPLRPPPAIQVERRFAEPIARHDDALGVIEELLGEAAELLEARGRGGRAFVARLYRSDGRVFSLAIESAQPQRAPEPLMRLFRERIGALADPIDPGFGFDLIRLNVPRLEPLGPTQLALEGGAVATEAMTALVDRLSTRIGRGRIKRFAPRDTHLPEQAVLALPAVELATPAPWPSPQPGEPPLRPLHLFDPPQPVEVIAAVPDGPPQRFRWRRTLHEVARYEGPERIAPEWWRRAPDKPGLTRDYYRVEDVRGRRFWLFRHGLYEAESAAPRWYVHGLFA